MGCSCTKRNYSRAKFLHLWRGNKLFEINLNSSKRSQSLRDSQQITFIMVNIFWSLRKNLSPPPPLFLTDNIKLDGMSIKINNTSLFYIVFQVLRRYFCEKLKGTATSSFISCFASVFISPDIIFYNFSELHSTLSEKDLSQIFLF